MPLAARRLALLVGLGAAAGVSAEPFRLLCTNTSDDANTEEIVVDPKTQTVLFNAVGAFAVTVTSTRIEFALRFPDDPPIRMPPPDKIWHYPQTRVRWWEIDRSTGLMKLTVHLGHTVVDSATYECELAGRRF